MKTVIVGIAGGSASGKSTVARALVQALGERCLLVLHDRYYRSLPEHLRERPLEYNFDHPSALDTEQLVADLAVLRSGRTVGMPRYDYAAHARADGLETVEPRPVILVEGILVLADPRLRTLIDHAVYVDTADEIRLARRVERDVAHRGRRVEQVLAQYERTVQPMYERYVLPSRAHASLILDGTQDLARSVEAVLALPGVTRPLAGAP